MNKVALKEHYKGLGIKKVVAEQNAFERLLESNEHAGTDRGKGLYEEHLAFQERAKEIQRAREALVRGLGNGNKGEQA